MTKEYPVAETFGSVQGEGGRTGWPMFFIRLAGCNVGKPFTQTERLNFLEEACPLKVYQERCQDWAGNSFPCDTNYRMSEKIAVDKLVEMTGTFRYVSITGGEPLIHDLEPLLIGLHKAKKKIHIETSGTKELRTITAIRYKYGIDMWIALSPKIGYLYENLGIAEELKILVDEVFDESGFVDAFGPYFSKTWVQPVNFDDAYNMDNVNRCLELIDKHKDLKGISLQIHKAINVR